MAGRTKLIADIGSNWDATNRCSAVHWAADLGFDIVKFQYFTKQDLYGGKGPEQPPEIDILLPSISDACIEKKIELGCTAFSPDGVGMVNQYVARHKIASSEAVYKELLHAAKATEKPIIVSTGGLTALEVDLVMNELSGCAVTLLECVSNYPADLADYNFSVLAEWKKKYRCKVGISDHCQGRAALAGIALGVDLVEVHLDPFDTDGPDGSRHGFSLTLDQAKEFVRTARALEAATTPRPKDVANQHEAVKKYKRRVKAIADIKPGEKLVYGVNYGVYRSIEDDLHAAHAMAAEMYNGKVAKKALKPQDGIYVTDVQ